MRTFTNRLIRRRTAASAVALAALSAAGVGVYAATATAATTHHTPVAQTSSSATTVGVASRGKLGKVLVDASGRTLYMYTKDPSGKSDCSGSCAGTWIPLLGRSAAAESGSGLNSKLFSVVVRSNGYHQIAYDHHALYTYKGDTSSKTANGEAKISFGGFWYALNAKGDEVKTGSGPCDPTCTGY